MKSLAMAERSLLVSHILSMVFGLAGLLLILPNATLVGNLPGFGQKVFQWSMAGGGVVYMLFGTAAVALYAYRTLGLKPLLTFMIPAILLSLSSELLGTSTGFPFGHYRYLEGLGYKIAGLVPFTIPLSWFYLGFSAYVLARAGLKALAVPRLWQIVGAIAFGSLLLTSWDFVLDPAMSQTSVPFWIWEQPGAFFGMPYQNFAGWFGTGVVFMSVASLLWSKLNVPAFRDLTFPLTVYLSNLAFATVMSLAFGFWVPVVLGMVVGVAPAIAFYVVAMQERALPQPSTHPEATVDAIDSEKVKIPVA
ncbi:gamma-carotene 1'-hydroxylase CruF [Oscillatoria sp. FACHB-1406]|uniref:gamma-carotene 1'-hydroxylase CruF n=1 Tax=Oscillatoria sp. FACHB-1406 TaxID=2692846 RepID=UPI001685BA71|nr:carotenoid biosynthesis protein [Oscillatoria sp. FACHB-1406]MBD2576395.1 carotenoid biosynthesis protein [Oscillatoria sp. FACHB-1406]